MLAIVSACNAAAVGFALCAARTRDETIAVAAKSAAAFLCTLRDGAIDAASAAGVDARPRARTTDHLRWEWLASTATVLDGSPDGRLANECARILSEIDVTSVLGALGDRVVARFRAAVAEACSLAWAIGRRQKRQFAITFG